MKLKYCYTSLIVFVVMLSSCGGGGGAGGNTGNQIVANSSSSSVLNSSSSSSSSSVVTTPVAIAPDDQSFTLDEDSVLSGEIKTNYDYIGGSTDKDKFVKEGNTLKGGNVKIVIPEGADPKLYLNYTPAEDFYGDDEAIVYLTKYTNGVPGNAQAVKLNFHVRAVVDESLKFKINNEKLFTTGDQIRLSLPYHPDTQAPVASGTLFKLSIGDVPIPYSIDSESIAFVIPPEVAAGVKTLSLDFDYQNKPQHLTRKISSKIDYVDVEYWMGDKNRIGVTYVVFAENSVQRQKYLDWVTKEFTKLLSNPIVAQYSSYWNLAVIKDPAPENYASLSSGESKILIGDLKTTGEAYVKKYVPNVDWIILNTSLDGRATGGYPMTINYSPINVIMHEFGHVHGKLADEYSDEIFNPNPVYTEGSTPNVTNFNDYDSIPWKHWIADKTKIPGVNTAGFDGVGAFLGAFYAPNKFYRPMYDSLMRNTEAPLGPVNSEAWVLATYERLGLLGSVTSTKESGIRRLTIAKKWNSDVTKIDWYINDVKQNALTNQSSIAIDEATITTANYTVRAELTDLLGYIKNPNAYASFNNVAYGDLFVPGWKDKKNESFQKSWTFDKAASTKLQKQQAAENSGLAVVSNHWVSHTINIRNGEHQLTTTTPYYLLDTLLPVTAHSELRADIVDSAGTKLYSVGIDQPYFYYHEGKGMVNLKDRGAYKIKHPFINGTYQINIVDLRTNQLLTSLQITQAK
ncbi:hypothetical protein GCM10011613_34420 [Cellvibrio zantedeschiae]|uniref:Lipoprotein n=1 Tax=Cellvibrio zantedeschiae TaxID=1237077 RepID=A0ABQ3BCX4_9GAMM|nr:M64 family metallopeptidase [Cellvibrio zantedeschiae]GGY86411.1 hypothetical protein GCM10011613_34420 [Cellvibrio zantedeschiae]